MSITTRLEDAKLLYDHGRHEGALLNVLVAVAGSSRRRYPPGMKSIKDPSKRMGDGEAFKTFMEAEMQRVGTCSVLFNGKCNSAAEVFYKWLRCSLVHDAEMPDQIVFKSATSNCQASLHRDPGPPERLVVTHSIVLLIGDVVSTSAENADIPASVRRSLSPR